MSLQNNYKTEFPIKNKLGFHVRPIQRFAEMAQAFRSNVEVQVEDRKADGKSVLQLMGLRGNNGARMQVNVHGKDAQQCVRVLEFLGQNCFFVEDNLESPLNPERHLKRLAHLASCFKSDVEVEVDSRRGDATDLDRLKELDISPTTADIKFHIDGEDAEQARAILQQLVKYRFYVEEKMEASR